MHATSHKLDGDSKDTEIMADRTPPNDDPSMEEILASIRKIISDDDPSQAGERNQAPDAASGEEIGESGGMDTQSTSDDQSFGNLEALVSSGLTRVSSQEMPDTQETLEDQISEPEVEESLEDLRSLKRSMASASIEQQLEEMSENSDIIFKDEAVESAETPIEQVPAVPESAGDVLTLTQKVNEDGSITDIMQADAGGLSHEEMSPPSNMVTLAESAPGDPSLLAAHDPVDTPIDDPVANDALELVMMRTLRPMLKRWMDENLPPIVERVVRDELRRRPTK